MDREVQLSGDRDAPHPIDQHGVWGGVISAFDGQPQPGDAPDKSKRDGHGKGAEDHG